MRDITIIFLIFMFTMFVLCIGIVQASPTNTTYNDNNTWYDNQWGGDTGDNEYVELPPPETTDDDNGGPTGYRVCCLSSYLAITSVIGMMTVQRFKHKRLNDEK